MYGDGGAHRLHYISYAVDAQPAPCGVRRALQRLSKFIAKLQHF